MTQLRQMVLDELQRRNYAPITIKQFPGLYANMWRRFASSFVKTLKRAYMLDYIPFPREERRLPVVLSQEDVGHWSAPCRKKKRARNPLCRDYLPALAAAEQ